MVAAMQSLTVRELVAEASLGLRLIAGAEAPGRFFGALTRAISIIRAAMCCPLS